MRKGMVVERSGRRRALHGEDRESATKVERVGGIQGRRKPRERWRGKECHHERQREA